MVSRPVPRGGPPDVLGPICSLLVLLLAPGAWGAVRYVTKSGQDNPTCTQAAPCRTIQHAVDIASAGDTISIGQGKFHEPFGVRIDHDLIVEGAGNFLTRVDGSWPTFSLFFIYEGATVTITDLDVMHGQEAPAINNSAHLTLDRVRVRSNSSQGIMNWQGGTLIMSRSEIAKNAEGLRNQGVAVLDEVHIVANGGVGVTVHDPASSLTVTRSLISHNSSVGVVNINGTATLTNTTVSRSGLGVNTGSDGHTTLTHVTVADNDHQSWAPSAGGLVGEEGSEVQIINTIVANNAVGECNIPVSALNSLASDATCFAPGFGNLVADPKLEPLKWSSAGSTRVHALKSGSPAIDAGAPGSCAPVDQRGVLRPIDGDLDGVAQCDIGAYEYWPFKWGTEGGP